MSFFARDKADIFGPTSHCSSLLEKTVKGVIDVMLYVRRTMNKYSGHDVFDGS